MKHSLPEHRETFLWYQEKASNQDDWHPKPHPSASLQMSSKGEIIQI